MTRPSQVAVASRNAACAAAGAPPSAARSPRLQWQRPRSLAYWLTYGLPATRTWGYWSANPQAGLPYLGPTIEATRRPNDNVEKVTGAPPITFAEFARLTAQAWR